MLSKGAFCLDLDEIVKSFSDKQLEQLIAFLCTKLMFKESWAEECDNSRRPRMLQALYNEYKAREKAEEALESNASVAS